jgi:TPR repeat protein
LKPEAGMLDVAGAIALLEHAWTDGVTIAGFELGEVYERGVRDSSDASKYLLSAEPERAWTWYEKAAHAGQPNALGRMARRADWSAQQSPTGTGRNERWLEAFRLYAAASERARIENWPEPMWRDWRYRRASLARLLEGEGKTELVAETYEAVRQQLPSRAATSWTGWRMLQRGSQ